jgi:hypothetical protein
LITRVATAIAAVDATVVIANVVAVDEILLEFRGLIDGLPSVVERFDKEDDSRYWLSVTPSSLFSDVVAAKKDFGRASYADGDGDAVSGNTTFGLAVNT